MTKIVKKVYSVMLAFIMAVGMIVFPGLANESLALEATGNGAFDAFCNDSRFKDGASYGNRRPYISTHSCVQCCAYVCDFSAYCFNVNCPWDSRYSTEFHNAYEIKAGDVIRLGDETKGDGGTHYFAVLKRSGNRLYTAEGNMNGGRVRIGWNYTIDSANKIGGENHPFAYGAAFHIRNSVPIGCIDVCETKGGNKIRVAGWAYDPDDSSRSLSIHVYVNNNYVTSINASNSSPDVNRAYSISGMHRFDKTFSVSDAGNVTVDIYALDLQGITNPMLGRTPNQCTRFNCYISPSSGGTGCIQNGTYRIKSTNGSGKYVSVAPGQGYCCGNIALYASGKGDQLFTFKRNSDGSYTIRNSIGLVLDVRGAAYRGTVQLYTANGTNAQKWDVVSIGNGNYRIFNRACGLVMDISGNSSVNGADIHTWEANGTTAQAFRLERVR